MNRLKLFLIFLVNFWRLFALTFGSLEENVSEVSSDILEEIKYLRQEIDSLKVRVKLLENGEINYKTELKRITKVCENRTLTLESELDTEKFKCKIPMGSGEQSNRSYTFPFGVLYGDSVQAKSDGINTNIIFPFKFYGKMYTNPRINTNGLISLNQTEMNPKVKFFNADIDTNYGGSVYYRVSSECSDLEIAQSLIQRAEKENYEVNNLTSILIVTYHQVPFHKSQEIITKCPNTLRNSFQGVLVPDGHKSYVIFIYMELNWGEPLGLDYCTGRSTIYTGFTDESGDYRGFDNRIMIPKNYVHSNPYLLSNSSVGIPGIYVSRVDQIPPSKNNTEYILWLFKNWS